MIEAIGAPIVMVEFRSDQGTVFMQREFEVCGVGENSRRDTFAWCIGVDEIMDMFLCNARIAHNTKETCQNCLIRVLNACGKVEEESIEMPPLLAEQVMFGDDCY